MNATLLDCGHEQQENVTVAHLRQDDGTDKTMCAECSYAWAMADMYKHGDTFGYWSPEDGFYASEFDRTYSAGSPMGLNKPNRLGHITTFTGKPMLRVTSVTRRRVGFGYFPERYYFRAIAPDGSYWYGTGAGEGMYARMKRSKEKAALAGI